MSPFLTALCRHLFCPPSPWDDMLLPSDMPVTHTVRETERGTQYSKYVHLRRIGRSSNSCEHKKRYRRSFNMATDAPSVRVPRKNRHSNPSLCFILIFVTHRILDPQRLRARAHSRMHALGGHQFSGRPFNEQRRFKQGGRRRRRRCGRRRRRRRWEHTRNDEAKPVPQITSYNLCVV